MFLGVDSDSITFSFQKRVLETFGFLERMELEATLKNLHSPCGHGSKPRTRLKWVVNSPTPKKWDTKTALTTTRHVSASDAKVKLSSAAGPGVEPKAAPGGSSLNAPNKSERVVPGSLGTS